MRRISFVPLNIGILSVSATPPYDHCAVLVAEDITSRFLNVISLFNGTGEDTRTLPFTTPSMLTIFGVPSRPSIPSVGLRHVSLGVIKLRYLPRTRERASRPLLALNGPASRAINVCSLGSSRLNADTRLLLSLTRNRHSPHGGYGDDERMIDATSDNSSNGTTAIRRAHSALRRSDNRRATPRRRNRPRGRPRIVFRIARKASEVR